MKRWPTEPVHPRTPMGVSFRLDLFARGRERGAVARRGEGTYRPLSWGTPPLSLWYLSRWCVVRRAKVGGELCLELGGVCVTQVG